MQAALFGGRLIVAVIVASAGWGAGPVLAQEDLNRGKSAAQLFASDCADCHRNPRALGNRSNANSLASFLRVHYTVSRESAAAIAGYLVSLGPDPARGARPASPSRPRPSASQSKPSQAQPAEAKPAETKPAEAAPKPPESAPPPTAPASEPAPAAPPANPQ